MGGQEYTLDDVIDFADQQVTIRGSKVNHAKIKMTGNASFLTNNGFKLKFADIDCENLESETLLGTSTTPDEGSQVATGEYVVSNPIMLQGCNVTGLNRYLFYDMNSKPVSILCKSAVNVQIKYPVARVPSLISSILHSII